MIFGAEHAPAFGAGHARSMAGGSASYQIGIRIPLRNSALQAAGNAVCSCRITGAGMDDDDDTYVPLHHDTYVPLHHDTYVPLHHDTYVPLHPGLELT